MTDKATALATAIADLQASLDRTREALGAVQADEVVLAWHNGLAVKIVNSHTAHAVHPTYASVYKRGDFPAVEIKNGHGQCALPMDRRMVLKDEVAKLEELIADLQQRARA